MDPSILNCQKHSKRGKQCAFSLKWINIWTIAGPCHAGNMGKVDKSKRYSEHDITQCLSEIKNRVPMKTACRKYNIPRSTIKFRLSSVWSGKTTKGPHTVLTAAEETEIVNWISRMARKGFPLTKERLVTTVQTFLAANPRPKQMKAGNYAANFCSFCYC
uniref:(northern house mosquito) hypothetical protein n=1 Tax=Culex pipiens TaxID=7175 RepID=A0A8D8A9K4_CULPI